jgi:hypothetical protein
MTYLAAQPTSHAPHSVIFGVLALLLLGVALVPLWSTTEVATQRRFYWLGTFAAAASAFVALLPNWKAGLTLAVAGVVFMAFPAYFTSSLIKIRGKVYAYHIQDSGHAGSPEQVDPEHDPWPDAYGNGVTAVKLWTLMIGVVILTAGNVVFSVLAHRVEWTTYAAAIALIVFALGFGYGDASWGHRVTRGQYIQFTIIGFLTAGIFTVLYLVAFAAGRRWPLRRRESLEYRAHPRHQKRSP